MSVDLERARDVAVEAAGIAAEVLRATPLGEIRTKRDAGDLVTDVDTATERAVREHLAAAFPDHHVVGEEFGGEGWDGPTWYCDPVDGTTNLASGLPWTSFSLSLAVGREPLVGVVGDAWRREVLHATAGGGAYRLGLDGGADRPLRVSSATTLTGGVVLTEWAAHVLWPGLAELLLALGDRYCTARVMGSGTLAVASVGAGRAAGAVITDFHPEDHLAGALLCREAGAVVCDRDGLETAWPERGPFVVAAPGVLDELRALAVP
jgi:fructose-1,6-bisphosphatase/inositol monophosphatase family enzyme